jgi:hypothetical protein
MSEAPGWCADATCVSRYWCQGRRWCDDRHVAELYRDKWITCADDAIVIAWYYLWGPKRIPYDQIRSARTVRMTALRGNLRGWGSSNLHYWASLDPGRRRKNEALILDIGRSVQPYLTPDDVPAVAAIIKERAGLADVPFAGDSPYV